MKWGKSILLFIRPLRLVFLFDLFLEGGLDLIFGLFLLGAAVGVVFGAFFFFTLLSISKNRLDQWRYFRLLSC